MILLLFFALSILPAVPAQAAASSAELGALADSFTANSQSFTLSTASRFFVVADSEPSGDLLQTVQLVQRQFAADSRPSSTPMVIAWGPESWIADGDIVIRLDNACGIASEGYKLEVTTTATVTASHVDGLLYGVNALHKHLRNAGSNTIQGFTAQDEPDTKQRAVSLDCGRKYYSKNWICNFIREMSWMGYNTLELHFSDDSGFRADFWDPDYYTEDYQPVNDFSWLCGSNYTSWTLSAYKNDPDKGKFLTTAEVVEILQTAKEYHIDVIPAFDSPSHLDYTTWMYEQNYKSNPSYSFKSTYNNKTYYAADVKGCINYTNSTGWSTALRWPYYSTIDIVDEHAKAFVFELYIDIANFFKAYSGSTDFSIGADEVNLSTSNLASGYSFTWGFPDFVDYINELNTLLNNKGYTMRMYNDFMGSTSYNASSYDFADNIEILYWDSPFNPNASSNSNHTEPVSYYVNKGMTLYNCIQTGTYYALRITGSGSDARSVYNRQWTFYHANEEDIYNEWYPADISEKGDYSENVSDVPEANLGGAYYLIWCDYACVSTEAEIWNGVYDKTTQNTGEFYSLRDRMWSNTTKMWNWDINSSVSFDDFTAVRDAYGDFPGAGTSTTSCSEKIILPAATEPVPGYAGGCEDYVSYCQVRVTADTNLMSLPTSAEAFSVQLERAGVGEIYTATRLYENPDGQLWYKVQTRSGDSAYLRAANTVLDMVLTDDITITDATAPSAHVKGKVFLVQGDIASKYNTLTSVAVYIHSGFGTDGATVTGDSAAVTGNAYSLLNSTIDYNTSFGSVPLGNHTYAISADYTTNYADGDTVVAVADKVYLVEDYFVVVSASVDQSTCAHSYTETVLQKANCITDGKAVYACGTCGHVYEESIVSGGHDYASQTIPGNCQTYEKLQYTCTVCGDGYTVYPDEIMSDWQAEKPENVDESLIESITMYRYADYEITTSYETVMDGYTQLGGEWEQFGTGTVEYVPSWPSGFDTSSSLYAQYNQAGSKVTASETATAKTVINSDTRTGYLYYHWCYSGSYYSVASKSGSYTVFHAYYDTTNPSNYTCDTSDMSYKTSHTTCSNSNWWFVTSVNTQSYTNYRMVFTYGRWGDWSQWSETAMDASTTRKVESQTMYRYVTAELGDHDYEFGACTVCGATCYHSFRNNVCVICQYEKPALDLYLFGNINGGNYGCEEDQENLGEYKFADGVLVATFTADSYVGIKSADNGWWYMTDGSQGSADSATLYNVQDLGDGAVGLYVPGGVEVTFTLTDNGDDTYVLSYEVTEVSEPVITLTGVSLSFEDEVFYNLYFTVTDMEVAAEDMGLLIWDAEPAAIDMERADQHLPGAVYDAENNRYMVRTEGVAAKNLGDTKYLVAYAKQADGSYIFSNSLGYSAKKYAMSRLENSNSDTMKALCVAMLNYGAAAQEYFGYKTDELINSDLNDEHKALVEAYRSDMVADRLAVDAAKVGEFTATEDGFSAKRASVSFDDAFSINYYYTASRAVNTMTFYYWSAADYTAADILTAENATGTMVMKPSSGENQFWANVEDIAAKQIDETVFACGVYTVDGVTYCTGVSAYSLGYYCQRNAAKDSDMQDLAAFTAVYGYYAKQFFAQ